MAMQKFRPGGKPAVSDVEEAYKRLRQRRGEIPPDEQEAATDPTAGRTPVAGSPAGFYHADNRSAPDPLAEQFKQHSINTGYNARTVGPGGLREVGAGQLPVYQPDEPMVARNAPPVSMTQTRTEKPWWDGPAPSGLDAAGLKAWIIKRNVWQGAAARQSPKPEVSDNGESVTGAPAPNGAPAPARRPRAEVMAEYDKVNRRGDELLYLLKRKDAEIERESDPQRKSLLRQERAEIAGKRHQYTTAASQLLGTLGEGPRVLDAAANRSARADIVGKELEVVNGQIAELKKRLTPPEMRAGRVAEGRKQLAARGRSDLIKGANKADADEFAEFLGRDFRGTMTEEQRNRKLTDLMHRRRELEKQHQRLTATGGHWFNETMAEAEKSSAAQAAARDEWMARMGSRQAANLEAARGLDDRTSEPGFYGQTRQLADQQLNSAQRATIAQNEASVRTANAQPQTKLEDDPKFRAKVAEYKTLALDLGISELKGKLGAAGVPTDMAGQASQAIKMAAEIAGKIPGSDSANFRVFKGVMADLKKKYDALSPDAQAAFRQQMQSGLADANIEGSSVRAVGGLWNRFLNYFTPANEAMELQRAMTADDLVSELVGLGVP
jgi:hypothetical protein